jgi:hypothetical protein
MNGDSGVRTAQTFPPALEMSARTLELLDWTDSITETT